jgi:hypothetical protein
LFHRLSLEQGESDTPGSQVLGTGFESFEHKAVMGIPGAGILAEDEDAGQGKVQGVSEVYGQIEGRIIQASLGFLHPEQDEVAALAALPGAKKT